MMANCLICKAPYGYYDDVSFHRIPEKIDKRQQWAAAIGKDIQEFKKSSKICSAHFDKNYFVYKIEKNGMIRRCLQKDAVPYIVQIQHTHNEQDEIITSQRLEEKESAIICSPSCVQEVQESSPTKFGTTSNEFSIRLSPGKTHDISPLRKRKSPKKSLFEKENDDSPSKKKNNNFVTLTPPDPENVNKSASVYDTSEGIITARSPGQKSPCKRKGDEPDVESKVKKVRTIRFLGDMCPEDFVSQDTYQSFKRAFIKMKDELHTKNSTVYNLKKEMSTLKQLLQDLHDKGLISSDASSDLQYLIMKWKKMKKKKF